VFLLKSKLVFLRKQVDGCSLLPEIVTSLDGFDLSHQMAGLTKI